MITFFDYLAIATQSSFKNQFYFLGKVTASSFWYFFLFFLPASAVVRLVDHRFLSVVISINALHYEDFVPAGYLDDRVGFEVLLNSSAMAIPTFSFTVSRLHDVNNGGWWCCFWVLPLPVAWWFWLIPRLTSHSAQTTNILALSTRSE
jgi:uncharacterized membrane protein YhaH (DUF805 family)